MDSIMPLAIQAQSGEDSKGQVDAMDEEPYMVSVFICMPSDNHPHHERHSHHDNHDGMSSREAEDWQEDASLAIGTANVVIEGPIPWSIPNAANANPNSIPAPTLGRTNANG